MTNIEHISALNWSLDEILAGNIIKNNDEISRGIIKELIKKLDPKHRKIYEKFNLIFREDLYLLHENEGKVFFTGEAYGTWFRAPQGFIIYKISQKSEIFSVVNFEKVLESIISPNKFRLLLITQEPLSDKFITSLDYLYNENKAETEVLYKRLIDGETIQVMSPPYNLSVTPLVSLITGFIWTMGDTFNIIGQSIEYNNKFYPKLIGYTFNHIDGQRILASLVVNPGKWEVIRVV